MFTQLIRYSATTAFGFICLCTPKWSRAESPPFVINGISIRSGTALVTLPAGHRSYRLDDGVLVQRDEIYFGGGVVAGPSLGLKFRGWDIDVSCPLTFAPFDSNLSSAVMFSPGVSGGVSFLSYAHSRPAIVNILAGMMVPFANGPDNAILTKNRTLIAEREGGTCGAPATMPCSRITEAEFAASTKTTPLLSFIIGIQIGL